MPENPFDLLARFYDAEHSDFLDDLPLYLGLARRVGGPILELACGTGRLLLPLARAGFELVGVDSSSEMLALAEARLMAEPELAPRVQLLRRDLCSARLRRRFKLVILALDSFGLLIDQADQRAALGTARRHLAHAGLLVLDVANGNVRGSEASEETSLRSLPGPDGRTIARWVSRVTDHSSQVDRLQQIFDETDSAGVVRRTSVDLTLRYFTRFELELLLEQAGFFVEALFGDYDLSPFGPRSERLIALAHVC